MTIRSLIIDDDPFILELLQDKLNQYFPEVEVMAVARNGRDGLEKIKRYQPDLIFLDVEMTDMTGFELLNYLDQISFQTIFITSYRHYAIKAIRFNALDYLVKPIDLGELKQAIRRYKSRLKTGTRASNLKQALRNITTTNPSDQTLTLFLQDGEWSITLGEIIRIQGERNYSNVYLVNQGKKLVSKTLGEFEELLSDKSFFRSHKSHLINGVHIVSQPYSNVILLSDQTQIPIARRKKEVFKAWYTSMKG